MSEVTGQRRLKTPAGSVGMAVMLPARKPRSLWSDAWRQFQHHRLAVAGSFVLIFMVIATIVGPFLWPIPWNKFDLTEALQGPSPGIPLEPVILGMTFLPVFFGVDAFRLLLAWLPCWSRSFLGP